MRIARDRLVVNGGADGVHTQRTPYKDIDDLPLRAAPHNLEAEQALLGAILVNNEAHDRVSGFLESHHFFDPLHQQIYETAAKLIAAGKQVTPITLKTFFERAEPIGSGQTVPQYLGWLGANATTIINAADYGRTIYDLATRRQLVWIGESMASAAYDSPADLTPAEQLAEARERLDSLERTAAGVAGLADGIVATVASSITPVPVAWVWPHRIPRGKLAILGGHPAEGKTLISLYMAGVVSTGGRWADGTQAERGNVLILSAEDDAADTIVPRLMAAGADLDRCHIVEAVRERGAPRQFSLLRDLERLEVLLDRMGGASLMMVDVIDSYLGETDTHRNAAVRGVLAPLAEMAARHRLAVLGLTHFRKAGADRAVLRFTGSIAFVGQARAGWIATPEMGEDGEPTGRRLLLAAKMNLAPDIGGLAYRIEGCTVGDGIETCRIVWEEGTIMMGADEALAPHDTGREEEKSATEEAADFLKSYLEDKWRIASALIKAAREAGISQASVKRARAKLRCQTTRLTPTGSWLVALPGVVPPEAPEAPGAPEAHR